MVYHVNYMVNGSRLPTQASPATILYPGCRLTLNTAHLTPAGTPVRLPLIEQSEQVGLNLLANAALQATGQPVPAPVVPRPFNPAALLPARIVKKILNLEFVDMAEITKDDNHEPTLGRPQTARPPIQDISQWVERYALMAGILASRFPNKAPVFFAYLATIVRAERNYQPGSWVAYDRQYRREALARRDLNWSRTDTTLYSEAFTGRAKSIPRCEYCLQEDHTSTYCPCNPNRPMFGWFPNPVPANPQSWPSVTRTPAAQSATNRKPITDEICNNFNQGRCTGKKALRCTRTHACQICQGNHTASRCSRSVNYSRPRSPRQNFPAQINQFPQHPPNRY